MHNKKLFHLLPWVVSALGLAVMVVNWVNGYMFNSFLKKQSFQMEHAYMPHFPAEELLFFIGLLLCVGGIIVGIRKRRSAL